MSLIVASILGDGVTVERIRKALWEEFALSDVSINVSELKSPPTKAPKPRNNK